MVCGGATTAELPPAVNAYWSEAKPGGREGEKGREGGKKLLQVHAPLLQIHFN